MRTVPLELEDEGGVPPALSNPQDAVVHLAAVIDSEARDDPGRAWVINAAGTARIMDALISVRERGLSDPIVLSVSSSEVYDASPIRYSRRSRSRKTRFTLSCGRCG